MSPNGEEKQGVTGQVQGLASMPLPPRPAATAASLGGGDMGASVLGGGVMYMGVPPHPGITPWPIALGSFPDVTREVWQMPSQCSIEQNVSSPCGPAKVYNMGHPGEVPFGSCYVCASGAPETATEAMKAVADDEAEAVAEEVCLVILKEVNMTLLDTKLGGRGGRYASIYPIREPSQDL